MPGAAPINPADPTDYGPGTPGKLAVLSLRAAARLPLFHDADALAGAAPPHLPEGVMRDGDRFRARLWVPRLRRQLHVGCFGSVAEAVRGLERARCQHLGPPARAVTRPAAPRCAGRVWIQLYLFDARTGGPAPHLAGWLSDGGSAAVNHRRQ